jgi:Icc-related predicted phosphoesterase
MHLAVFGDVHGNLAMMYRYVGKWERKQNIQIAAVLQTGDLGVFKRGGPLDKATSRYMKNDPTELGCADYISGEKRASHLTLFVRGNHEDFDFLMGTSNAHIDPFGLIRHLSSGKVFVIEKGKETVRVNGLGGVLGRAGFTKGDGRKYFTDKECNRLLCLEKGSMDILLFHEAPKGYGVRNLSDAGADEVTLLIEHLQPHLAFYGHYGYPPEPFYIGKTLCAGMNNPDALLLPNRDGAMGVIDTSNWAFEFVYKGDI